MAPAVILDSSLISPETQDCDQEKAPARPLVPLCTVCAQVVLNEERPCLLSPLVQTVYSSLLITKGRIQRQGVE